MKEWVIRIGGAFAIGAIWAAVWAAVGALIKVVDSSRTIDGLWLGPAIGMQPGFLGGVLFAVMLGIAAGGRRLDELSFPTVAACGAIAGFLVGVLPFAINEPPSTAPLWLVGVIVIGSMILVSVISAAGSLVLARGTSAQRR